MASILYRVLSGLITSVSNVNNKIKLANSNISGLVYQGEGDVEISNGIITIPNNSISSGKLSQDLLDAISGSSASYTGGSGIIIDSNNVIRN